MRTTRSGGATASAPNSPLAARRARRPAVVAALALAATGLGAAHADAATQLTIRGAGWGHGVGMSQYGAYGYASNGWTYDDILAHYYTGTQLGSASSETVRTLLQSVGEARVTGARSAGGKRLDAGKTYRVRRGGAGAQLLTAAGRPVASAAVLRVAGSGTGLRLVGGSGSGSYRGALEFRATGVGVQVVNAASIDDYVRGVVARESPASWPLEALKAQAVAARSYALTTSKGGNGFDQYNDTRSQVYGGVAAETATTNAAVAQTAGQVVTYDGRPVTTYFFSTSGGRTEDVEKSVLGRGGEALPWLRSVDDPYDDLSSKHRWGPYRWSMATAQRRLGSWVKGRFKGIKVIRRGSSPRIMDADVVGTGGTTRVTGPDLRARLGLNDSWIYFTTISSSARTARSKGAHAASAPELASGEFGVRRSLRGEVFPRTTGSRVTVQRRAGQRWRTVKTVRTTAGGRYVTRVGRAGTYRVRYLVDVGPTVRVR